MGIDGIGKKPPTPASGGASGVGGVERTGKTFEVKTEGTAEVSRAAEVAGVAPTPLERLRAGEIDVDQYVDLKIEQATSHLQGLSRAELDSIRGTLRSQVENDPSLSGLVAHATGSTPTRKG